MSDQPMTDAELNALERGERLPGTLEVTDDQREIARLRAAHPVLSYEHVVTIGFENLNERDITVRRLIAEIRRLRSTNDDMLHKMQDGISIEEWNTGRSVLYRWRKRRDIDAEGDTAGKWCCDTPQEALKDYDESNGEGYSL